MRAMPDASDSNPKLSRERIVAEALTMAEAGGIDAVTLRPLAARLGVSATALYGHVGSRATLLELLLARRMSDHYRPIPPEIDWPDALRWTADTMWELYVPLAGLAAETLAGQVSTSATQSSTRELLDRLEAGGFEPDQAADAGVCFVHWALSFIASVERRPPAGAGYGELPGRDPEHPRAVFDRGIELLVRGLEAQAG
jgi:AcrR family transcriptional regulator